MRACFIFLPLLLVACAARTPVAAPTEPRELDDSLEAAILADAAATPDGCEAPFTLAFEEGSAERATYLATGCGFTFRYHVACTRPTDNGHQSAFWRCAIETSEEVGADDGAE